MFVTVALIWKKQSEIILLHADEIVVVVSRLKSI
jgi:hypothetical protein